MTKTPSQSPHILVLHGPSLGALGEREPAIYGTTRLAEIDRALAALATDLGATIECRQSNHVGVLIDWLLAAAGEGFRGILINPAAYAHTSLALADALRAIGPPAVEVHLTNTAAREPCRQLSLTAAACRAVVAGFGPDGYYLGLRGLVEHLRGFTAAAK